MGTAKRKSTEPSPDPPAVKKHIPSSTEDDDVRFAGSPVPPEQAKLRWPHRYQPKGLHNAHSSSGDSIGVQSKEVLQAQSHYMQAVVDGCVFDLSDDVHVQADEGTPDYIAKIVEIFEAVDGEPYFTARWFYRATDTVIKHQHELIDKKRVFYSDVVDDNPLGCIVKKLNIIQVATDINLVEKEKAISLADFYCDMAYSVPHFSFTALGSDNGNKPVGGELRALDLYCGCGAMSTGLSLGASLAGSTLVTRWAVDINPDACKSLELNHPKVHVRNEEAESFLALLKEWEKLCKNYHFSSTCENEDTNSGESNIEEEGDEDTNIGSDGEAEYEVESIQGICYGDPNKVEKPGLYLKVRWKSFDPSYDTWEPYDGLSNCNDLLKDFVSKGIKSRYLPLPGDVDLVCGGPPCQGMSGLNRFRKEDDVKNEQLLVFMNIIDFLKPKYILMENVVDLLKYSGGTFGCYAIGRLVSMNYQARLGIIASGSFGVPQCRYRVFLWGAHPSKKLPQYPLPTHQFVGKGVVTDEYKSIVVGYEEEQSCQLEKSLVLKDAISDLPPVTNDDSQEHKSYGLAPATDFQKYIRWRKPDSLEIVAAIKDATKKEVLYDHIPFKVKKDDYERVILIPKEKGANFRNLAGLVVGPDKKVQLDPSVERPKVSSGKPLVPDYAINFGKGKSAKPFGRLWWDEIVHTVVTRPEPHKQALLHPSQDRVLTVRENARIQGFPDWYRLYGPIKERYIQVGNAVAFPVSIPLGYLLGKAIQGVSTNEPATTIPIKFPHCLSQLSP